MGIKPGKDYSFAVAIFIAYIVIVALLGWYVLT